ncbi:MAG: BrnT family toxin [Actinomycetaceae bacterium]|nr:BrnT family toxin [Actinomycetaceae bacterium]
MLFEWDKKKAQSNLKKHRVSFVEAQEVFSDPYARVIDDPDHSYDEERFIIVGISSSLRVLVVAHCYRQGGDSIRIISARKATAREEEQYWRF